VVAAAAILLGANLAGCASSRSAQTPVMVMQSIIDADNAGDIDAAASCYTDDVVWIPPQGELVIGKSNVRDRYARMYGQYDVELSATYEETEVADTLAYVRGITQGRLIPRNGDDPVHVHDRFLGICRKHDGRWRVARLMWMPVE